MRFQALITCCLRPTSASLSSSQEQEHTSGQEASALGFTGVSLHSPGPQGSPLLELLTTTQAICLLGVTSTQALYKAAYADGRLLTVRLTTVGDAIAATSAQLGRELSAHKHVCWSATLPCVLTPEDLDAATYAQTKSPSEVEAVPPLLGLQFSDEKRIVDPSAQAGPQAPRPVQAALPAAAASRPPVCSPNNSTACLPPGRNRGQRSSSFLSSSSAFLRMSLLSSRRQAASFEVCALAAPASQGTAAAGGSSPTGATAAPAMATATAAATATQEPAVQQAAPGDCTLPPAQGLAPVLAGCTSANYICMDTPTAPSALARSFPELERSAFSTPAAASVATASTQQRPHTLSSFLTGATGATTEEDGGVHVNTGDGVLSCTALRTGSGLLLPPSCQLWGNESWGQPLQGDPLQQQSQNQGLASTSHEAGVLLVLQWLKNIGAQPGKKLLVSVSEWCDAGVLQQALAQPHRPGVNEGGLFGIPSACEGRSPGWSATDQSTCRPPSSSVRQAPRRSQTFGESSLAGKEPSAANLNPPMARSISKRGWASTLLSTEGGADAGGRATGDWMPTPFMTLKLSSGQQRVLARKAALLAALRCAVQIAEGLAHLHESGYYHTNLDPTTIYCYRLPPAPAQASGHTPPDAEASTATAAAAEAKLQAEVEQLISASPLGHILCKVAVQNHLAPVSAWGPGGPTASAKACEPLLAASMKAHDAGGAMGRWPSAAPTAPPATPAGAASPVALPSTSCTASAPSLELSLNTAHWRALAYVAPEVVRGDQAPIPGNDSCPVGNAGHRPSLSTRMKATKPAKSAVEDHPATSPAVLGGSSSASLGLGKSNVECVNVPALTCHSLSQSRKDAFGQRPEAPQDVVAGKRGDVSGREHSPRGLLRKYRLEGTLQQELLQQLQQVGGHGEGCPGSAGSQAARPAASASAAGPGPSANAFTYGMILWQLLTGRTPYYELHPAQILVGKATGDLDRSLVWPEDVEDDVRLLGETCLDCDPSRRPSMRSAIEVLAPAIDRLVAEIRQVLQLAWLQ